MAQATRELARQLAAHVEWLALNGSDWLPADVEPRVDPASKRAAAPSDERPVLVACTEQVRPSSGVAPRVVTATLGSAESMQVAASAPDLGALGAAIADCRRCRLAGGRTQVVFGVGNPNARLMFVGEGPGRDEDLRGEPFVGRAGQLLTDIIEKGMKLRRSDVYICNVVKCRPPDNRNPEPDEVAACSPFLERQIALVHPEVIVALGKFAAQTLLASATPITRLRGKWYEYLGVPLMPTFHPAYLLRNPGDKRLVWEDVQLVMARLGIAR